MLEYNGEVEVEHGGEVAYLNAQGGRLTLVVPSESMLVSLIGLYRRFPVSKTLSRLPFIFDGHQLVVSIPDCASLKITRRQGWLRVWLPYKVSISGVGWWLRHGPTFLYRFWRS